VCRSRDRFDAKPGTGAAGDDFVEDIAPPAAEASVPALAYHR
jgi:hypothetical protein